MAPNDPPGDPPGDPHADPTDKRPVEDKLVVVAICNSSIEGPLLKGFLESHDIYCYVQGDEHRQMLGLVGTYVEPRIMVPSSDAERAGELIEAFREASIQGDGPHDDDDDDDFDDEAHRFEEKSDGSPYRHPATLQKSQRQQKKPTWAFAAGLFLGAGSGQRYAGALRPSMPFAAIEIAGWVMMVGGYMAPLPGAMAIAALRLVDATIGALSLQSKSHSSSTNDDQT